MARHVLPPHAWGGNYAWAETVTKSISDVVSENSYTVSSGSTINTKCTSIDLDANINVSVAVKDGATGNTGTFWGTSPSIDWRLYQADEPTITVSAGDGYSISTVKFTYGNSNTGVINTSGHGQSISSTYQIKSGTAYDVNATSATYYVGNTSAKSNGQARITAIEVVYSSTSGGGSTPTKTLSSIVVKTAPSTTTYTEGQTFNPAGLVITADYGTDGKEDVAYSSNESKFSFSPELTTALTTSNNKVTITYGGKTTEQSITVNAIPSHTATFYANGEVFGTPETVKEGSAITFPAEKPSIDDVVFIGWAESEIDGTQETAPTLVSSKNMGNTDAKFYAVFATAEGDETTETFGWEETTTPSNWVLGGTITRTEGTSSNPANSGSYYGALNSNSSVQFKNKVKVKSFSYYCVRKTNNTNTSIKIETSTNGTSWTEALSTTWATFNNDGKTYKKIEKTWDEPVECYVRVNIVTAAGRMLDDISITYGDVTYSDYCTSLSAKATPTLAIADADKNVALNYNGTKDVTISVSEAEYDGTLAVASTNEEVATVTYEGTTATINYVGEGTAYISVTAPSTTNYYAINATQAIKVTATDNRSVAEVTIDPATISVDNGANAEYTVTTVYDGTISVASNKESVATVSYSEGKVTVEGKSVGTATLTISGEGNANYKPFSKEFTITVNKVVPVGIKNLRSQITGTSSSKSSYEVKLVNAVVTYVNGSNAYIEDSEAGILIYKSSHGFTAGDVLNGVVTGQGYVYNGLKELTSITGFEKTTGGEIPCTEVTLATIAADMQAWESRRVIVKDITITETMGKETARYGKVSQGGNTFNVYEKSSGCAGEKLNEDNQVVASMICYPQDYNGVNTLGIWLENEITLTERADAQVVFDLAAGTGTSESPVAFTIGEDNTFPTAVVKDSEGNAIAGATVTYSTGNDAYISVDAETGVVTLKKYASKSNNVRVTATFAGNAEYKSATADYYLTIAKGTPVISFAESNVEVALDGVANHAAIVDAKYGSLGVTYSSSNPAVASFADASNSTLTLNTEGTTTISAQTVGNDTWKQSNKVSYTLTVTAPSAGYAYVTLDACDNDVEGYTEPLKVVKGRTVTLPAATTIKSDYTFIGWTSAGEVTKTTTAPALVETNYTANADVTLYPVFSKEESDGEPDTKIGWVLKGLNELDLNENVLIISTSGSTSKILSADQGSTGYFIGRDVTVEDGIVTSNEPANSDWIISKEGDNYSFTSNNNGYLYNMGCSYSNYEHWALTTNGTKTYSMESLGGNPYNHSGNYVYLDNSTWRMTTDASLSKIQFFQVDEYDVPGSTTTYYVSRTMNVLELDENATEIAEINDEYDKVVVKRTLKAGIWNTLCLPFDMTAAQIEENFGADAEVKILDGLTVNGTSYTMNFSDCDEIGAGLPCMIRVSNAVSTITVEGTVEVDTTEDPEDSATDSSNDNIVTFIGNYAMITVPKNDGNYIISSNKFYYVNSAVTSKGFRGYFNLFSLDGSNDAKALSFSFDENTTAIENVNVNGLDDNNVFDLSGRKVVKAQKNHLYIKNGHKYLAK